MCQTRTESCFFNSCDTCRNNHPSSILRTTANISSIDENENLTWFNWLRVNGNVHLQEINSNLSNFLDNIDEQWSKILHHHYVKEQQNLFLSDLKKNSNEYDYIVVTCDFAENYALIAQREIQSAYYSHEQVSIFTIHIKAGQTHSNLAIISDHLNHDSTFVYVCQKILQSYIKVQFPSVKKLYYASDGAAMHFKNKFNILNLTFHEIDFGIPAEWIFTATSHGKSACDGNVLALICIIILFHSPFVVEHNLAPNNNIRVLILLMFIRYHPTCSRISLSSFIFAF